MTARGCLRAAAGALAVVLAGMSGPAPATEPLVVLVRTPAAQQLDWRGLSGPDLSGTSAPIMYPAPGIVGLLVAVATHAAVVEGSRQYERSQQQIAADRVLDPYRDAMAAWAPDALFAAALAKLGRAEAQLLPAGARPAANAWLVELQPRFAMTQDQRSLVLDGAVRVVRTGDPAAAPFDTAVRVVSAPLRSAQQRAVVASAAVASASASASASAWAPAPSTAASMPLAALDDPAPPRPQPAWSADGARALKNETAAMLAHAIAIALAQAQAPAAPAGEAPTFRTHRYLMGDQEQMERSQLLARGCGRIVVRTLRGALLSGPVSPAAGQADCATPYALSP